MFVDTKIIISVKEKPIEFQSLVVYMQYQSTKPKIIPKLRFGKKLNYYTLITKVTFHLQYCIMLTVRACLFLSKILEDDEPNA